MVNISSGWPKGDRASSRMEVGALTSRTAVMACCSFRRCRWMSATVLRSENCCQRVARRSMARLASGLIGLRGGGKARAHPARSRKARRRTLRVDFRTLTLDPPETLPELVHLLLDAGRGRVQLQRLLPGRQRFLVAVRLPVGVAQLLE